MAAKTGGRPSCGTPIRYPGLGERCNKFGDLPIPDAHGHDSLCRHAGAGNRAMYRFGHERHAYTEMWLNLSSLNCAVLHLHTGKRPDLQRWVNAEVLYRDDGFKLIRLGSLPPFQGHTTYRYSKGHATFDLRADRSLPGGTITGTYNIHLNLKPGMFGESEQERVAEMVADVDSALRAWPTPVGLENIPIGVTYFKVGIDGVVDGKFAFNSYDLVLGAPVVLAHAPRSARWKPRTVIHPLRTNIHGGEPDRDRESLIRDDGVQLVRIRTCRGPENDGPDAFHYSDHGGSFVFSADYRMSTAVSTDTWEVLLDPPYLPGLSPMLRAQLGSERCTEIVSNIEEALYAWPLDRGHKIETPINRVVFLDPT